MPKYSPLCVSHPIALCETQVIRSCRIGNWEQPFIKCPDTEILFNLHTDEGPPQTSDSHLNFPKFGSCLDLRVCSRPVLILNSLLYMHEQVLLYGMHFGPHTWLIHHLTKLSCMWVSELILNQMVGFFAEQGL